MIAFTPRTGLPYYDDFELEIPVDYGEDYAPPQERIGTAGRQQQQQQQHQLQLQNKKVSQDFSALSGNGNGGGTYLDMVHISCLTLQCYHKWIGAAFPKSVLTTTTTNSVPLCADDLLQRVSGVLQRYGVDPRELNQEQLYKLALILQLLQAQDKAGNFIRWNVSFGIDLKS